jgi:hypothetical protein
VERETGIEPASLAWKARVLPLNYSRIEFKKSTLMRDTSTLCLKATLQVKNQLQKYIAWWRELDSNQRTRKRADLQSAAINHSAISPRRTSEYTTLYIFF